MGLVVVAQMELAAGNVREAVVSASTMPAAASIIIEDKRPRQAGGRDTLADGRIVAVVVPDDRVPKTVLIDVEVLRPRPWFSLHTTTQTHRPQI